MTGRRGRRALLLARGPGARGVAVELGVVAIVLAVNFVVRRLTLDDLAVAMSHAHDVLALEESWRLDWEHAAQDAVRDAPWLESFATWFYVWGYLPVVALALVVAFVRRPDRYARLRNALLAAGVVGLPFYLLYPLAPPRLTGLGYADPVAASVVEGSARPAGVANEIAAMPSFHVGFLVVVAVLVHGWTGSRLLRAWCVVHPVLMCWVVVATGNHWVVDLPAGVAIAVVGLAVAGRVARTGLDGSDDVAGPVADRRTPGWRAGLRRALFVRINRVTNVVVRRLGLRRFRGGDLLHLTTTGRRSGRPRTTPALYVRDRDRWVVAASNGGARLPRSSSCATSASRSLSRSSPWSARRIRWLPARVSRCRSRNHP